MNKTDQLLGSVFENPIHPPFGIPGLVISPPVVDCVKMVEQIEEECLYFEQRLTTLPALSLPKYKIREFPIWILPLKLLHNGAVQKSVYCSWLFLASHRWHRQDMMRRAQHY